MAIYRNLLFALALAASAFAQSNWYAPDAATATSVKDALAAAKQANKRVLVMYTGAWCGLCEELHQTAMADPDVPRLVQTGYQMVQVPVEDFAKLEEFARQTLHTKVTQGNDMLVTLLSADGAVLSNLTAQRMLEGGKVSLTRVKAQLSEFLPGPPASAVFDTGVAGLTADKMGWVEFRADWCGWCKKMEHLFRETAATPILSKYYSVISVDTEKNDGSTELAKKLGSPHGTDGIPWFAVVDAKGKVLKTSEGPKGNIGYPDTDVELAHFRSMLQSTAKGITAAEVDSVMGTIAAIKAAEAKK